MVARLRRALRCCSALCVVRGGQRNRWQVLGARVVTPNTRVEEGRGTGPGPWRVLGVESPPKGLQEGTVGEFLLPSLTPPSWRRCPGVTLPFSALISGEFVISFQTANCHRIICLPASSRSPVTLHPRLECEKRREAKEDQGR